MKLKTIKETQAAPSISGNSDSLSPSVQPAPAGQTPLQAGERACPTRMDGAQPLFQHRVTTTQCQSKQRGMYHKCFTCAHSNARR